MKRTLNELRTVEPKQVAPVRPKATAPQLPKHTDNITWLKNFSRHVNETYYGKK